MTCTWREQAVASLDAARAIVIKAAEKNKTKRGKNQLLWAAREIGRVEEVLAAVTRASTIRELRTRKLGEALRP